MTLAESDYEGWVAYIDGVPIFEHAPRNPALLQAAGNGHQPNIADRATLPWREVPTARVDRLELYYARGHVQSQPAIRLQRPPGADHIRFIQLKMGGIAFGPGLRRPVRLGLMGYRVGYWDPRAQRCEMWEIGRDGKVEKLRDVKDPCAPKPVGHGYAREVLGAGQ
jgi:hypothetical protein